MTMWFNMFNTCCCSMPMAMPSFFAMPNFVPQISSFNPFMTMQTYLPTFNFGNSLFSLPSFNSNYNSSYNIPFLSLTNSNSSIFQSVSPTYTTPTQIASTQTISVPAVKYSSSQTSASTTQSFTSRVSNAYSSAKKTVKTAVRKVSDFGKAIVRNAKKYLGYNEKSGKYKLFTGGRPEAWCADYVTYVVKETCKERGISLAGFGSRSVTGLMDWGKNNGRFISKSELSSSNISSKVKPGDVIIFKSNGASHTGIVESIGANGQINTIEGNTSDKVAQRHYTLSNSTITGFVSLA